MEDPVVSSRQDIAKLSLYEQERCLLSDFLYLFLGVSEGKYISRKKDGDGYEVNSSLDVSLAAMVERVLPLCTNVQRVRSFSQRHSQYHNGLVSHALCAAIENLTQEYFLLIAQLEHQYREEALSLQKLWYYIQPSLHTMSLLSHVCRQASSLMAANPAGGGLLLQLLHDLLSRQSGDERSTNVLLYLLENASIPYMKILAGWIYHGRIEDPHLEFFVREQTDVTRDRADLRQDGDSYWQQRYLSNEEQLPSFLAPMADKILTSGKYLNVVRECGHRIEPLSIEPLLYSPNSRDYSEKITSAHEFASRHLLNLLMGEQQLRGRLKSVKHYFMLHKGDFLVHFMDTAEPELRKPASDIAIGKLQSLLELSVRTSSAASDEFHDDLKCVLSPHTLVQQLKGLISTSKGAFYVSPSAPTASDADASTLSSAAAPAPGARQMGGMESFVLDYDVQWPLSLVLSRSAITRYQILFRHLFQCRLIERQLCNAWTYHQCMKGSELGMSKEHRSVFRASFSLRQRMLHFLQTLQYYIAIDVLEPNWNKFEIALECVNTVDEVLKCHNTYLDDCLKGCMLTDTRLIKIITKLMSICIFYANYIESVMGTFTQPIAPAAPLSKTGAPRGGGATAAALVAGLGGGAGAGPRRGRREGIISEHAQRLAEDESFHVAVGKFESNFHSVMRLLLEALKAFGVTGDQSSHLLGLLDFNGYYHNHILR
eukprot:TRINITY_DN1988_c0_g1_i3.p1 TRINITY_DN1988_c0_g1~~TRINITY_DN1988_c0_g1_i3.p1  ORF type:complete len:712 (-),score=144.71 TRINITY_DN1988_c0_g1_i3:263-2398(-)